jgi:hypothetical protein
MAISALLGFGGLVAVMWYQFGTIEPCGILRQRLRVQAASEPGVRGIAASSAPDWVIDSFVRARYGALTPWRCVGILVGTVNTKTKFSP